METQPPPASQSLTTPAQPGGGVPPAVLPVTLRSGAEQDVPDAVINPVSPAAAPAGDTRFGPPGGARASQRAKVPLFLIVVAVTFLIGITAVLIATGFFGLFG